jgi:hypothetical protein
MKRREFIAGLRSAGSLIECGAGQAGTPLTATAGRAPGANETSRGFRTPAQDFQQLWGRAALHSPRKEGKAVAIQDGIPTGCM